MGREINGNFRVIIMCNSGFCGSLVVGMSQELGPCLASMVYRCHLVHTKHASGIFGLTIGLQGPGGHQLGLRI